MPFRAPGFGSGSRDLDEPASSAKGDELEAYKEKADAVVIGDTPYDADAASWVGLRSIGVRSGGFPDADLRDAGYIAIYEDPADLLARYQEFLKDAAGG